MQFELVIWNNAEFDAAIQDDVDDPTVRLAWRQAHEALQAELTATGELLRSNELSPEVAAVVRAGRDAPHPIVTSPAPFSEGEMWLGGYYIVECDSLVRAIDIAGRFVEARFAPIEVRQLVYPDD